ncbi:MAG: hypothetical protein M1818_000195 [Claussenomyces sp. TS43310]|nr:MAG: hypothetical protein M1818_000195 [Claussenomyces sp. TS43310]
MPANLFHRESDTDDVPVIDQNFPDPAIFQDGNGSYYAYATNGNGVNVQTASAPALTGPWTVLSGWDAMPNLPAWTSGAVWAPDVTQAADGTYVLYFSATDSASSAQHCVGTATSTSAKGPFTAAATAVACPIDQGGAIDPSAFIDDDGTYYLVYKVDGNSIGHGGTCGNTVDPIVSTPIMLQQMENDAVTPVGSPVQILDRGQYDGPLIEAPDIIRSSAGTYILFFSSNCYSTTLYDVSYATASAVTGPWTKSSAPLLVTGDYNLTSPGGASASLDGTAIVFHANCDAGSRAKTNDCDFRLNLPTTVLPSADDALAALQKRHELRFEQACSSDHPTLLSSSESSEPHGNNRLPEKPVGRTASPSQMISQRTLPLDRAQLLLCKFHGMCPSFPFVVIPMDATVQNLSRHSPFLLLAAMTVASMVDIPLHHQLDHEFRRVLGSKLIVEGQKNLDLLQGLLVYITWFPNYLRTRCQQVTMYMNLAVTLSSELGLDRPWQELEGNLAVTSIQTEALVHGENFSRASQRAYLGSYYLSTGISTQFEKVNVLECGDLMEKYGRMLAENPEFPSDVSLLALVQAQNVEEKVRNSLRPQKRFGYNLEEPFEAEKHVRDCEIEAEQWRAGLSKDAQSFPAVVLAERFMSAKIHTYDMTIVRLPQKVRSWLSASPGYMSLKHILTSLEAVKKFSEYLLSISAPFFLNLTAVQWGHAVQVLIILFKLSFPIQSCPGWNPRVARESAPLCMYLDAICYRLQNLSSVSVDEVGVPKNPDAPFIFKTVLAQLKDTFERRVSQIPSRIFDYDEGGVVGIFAGPDTGSVSKRSSHGCPMFEPSISGYLKSWQEGGASNDRDMGRPDGKPQGSTVPVYHDIWATMTMTWASE